MDELPIFDKIDSEIGLAAVFNKPPLATIFRSVGSFVNNEVSTTGVGDNLDIKIDRFFGIGFDINVSVCPECMSRPAVVISRDPSIIQLHPLRERHAQGQTKQE